MRPLRRPRIFRHPTLVVIDVVEPDTLDRISLMNATLIKLVAGTTLVEVREADYRHGHMEVVTEARPRVVTCDKRVRVRPRALHSF